MAVGIYKPHFACIRKEHAWVEPALESAAACAEMPES